MEADDWDRRYQDSALVWGVEPNRFLEREVADLAPGRALDLGTGEGRNAVWLAGRGWSVTAVDFSAVALAKARELAGAHGAQVEWVEADLRTYRPPARAFELVVVAYIHLPRAQLRPLLRAASEAVSDGGTLIVIGHDRRNLTDGVGGPTSPEVLYRAEELVPELAGLSVESAGEALRPVVTDHGEVTAIDTLIRAVRR